ncbi:hypothetical protein WJX84_006226 [Apatococcus fuscideae]|uniref:Uncharacterized protein n=1 Tax=Apatococcus fuscideae TaxID=2026836 RepID=A0AAW1RSR7_9CHLO
MAGEGDKPSFASAVADGEQKSQPTTSSGTGNPAEVGSSFGVTKLHSTATGATSSASYGASSAGNQSTPTGPMGGITAGNQTTPGAYGNSFGTAGYNDQVHGQGNSNKATSTPGGIPTAAQQALGGTSTGSQAPSSGAGKGSGSTSGPDLTKDAGPTPAEALAGDKQ